MRPACRPQVSPLHAVRNRRPRDWRLGDLPAFLGSPHGQPDREARPRAHPYGSTKCCVVQHNESVASCAPLRRHRVPRPLRTALHTGFLCRFNFRTYDTRFRGKVNRYRRDIWCFFVFVPFSFETRIRGKSRSLGDLGTSQAGKGQRGRSSPRRREGRTRRRRYRH